mmetsp:Transcript_11809/g.47643  ORF Transcript_11809/g.47643 Transcript_11809/m.47643 type:complete len:339 (-) Transcript_11809:179-1195(-)
MAAEEPDAAGAAAAVAADGSEQRQPEGGGGGPNEEEEEEEDADDDDDEIEASARDDEDAARRATRRRNARFLDGMITRKVVKQTVMTSVYGVTFVGARDQIKRRLEESIVALLDAPESDERRAEIARLEALGIITDRAAREVDEPALFHAAVYVAQLTLDVLSELFSSARLIMAWLGDCARIVALDGQPVSWITPLGLPVVQPYRNASKYAIKTVAQNVLLVDTSEQLPVATRKQRTAFPPNFIHSLDSTHMLLTAIDMSRRGYTFTAVHDSYWTHADDVDVMNRVLREKFLELYSRPILEDLEASFRLRYPHLDFPPIPDRGELDITQVLDAPYFFS